MYGWLYMYSRLPGTGMPKSCAHLLPREDAPILQELIQPLMHCTLSLVSGNISHKPCKQQTQPKLGLGCLFSSKTRQVH